MPDQKIKLEIIANDIREYFLEHPRAGDTVDGIASWWIARQQFRNATPLVHEALEYLVNIGELNKQRYCGRDVYIKESLH